MKNINLKKMSAVQTVRWAFDFASWQPTEPQILQAFSCVQPEEKERIGRFVFKKDAKASLIGRLLIRKFICENSELKYNEILLKRDENGKPFVDNDSIKGKLSFSVSHHGRLVVLFGQLNPTKTGIDVMTAKYQGGKDLNEFFRLMSRHFSVHEWDVIKNTCFSDHMRMLLFNRHWALKESYLKAVGTGITVDLRKIEFKIKTKFLKSGCYANDTELFVDNVKQDSWLFQEAILQSDHLIAIAVNSKDGLDENPFVFLNFDDVMQNATPLLAEDFSFCSTFLEKDEESY